MSNKKRKRKKSSKRNNKQINEELKVKELTPQEIKKYNVFCFIYLVLMLMVVSQLLENLTELNKLLTPILFFSYFIIMFFFALNMKMNWQKALTKPIKMFLFLLGVAYAADVFTTTLNYNALDEIKQSTTDSLQMNEMILFEEDNAGFYFDEEKMILYILDSDVNDGFLNEYQLEEDSVFDENILKKSGMFYSINDKLSFSYLDSEDDQLLLQVNHNEKRYLTIVSATNLLAFYKKHDGFDEPLVKLNNNEIYLDEEYSRIVYFSENEIKVSMYNEISDISDMNYPIRGLTYLYFNFSEETIDETNLSFDLIGEKTFEEGNVKKINLYAIRDLSYYTYNGYADAIEIIYRDGKSIISPLTVDSYMIKEE